MPESMLAEVAAQALARSGQGDQLGRQIDSVAIVESVSWMVPDPARTVIEALGLGADSSPGARAPETVRSTTGGCSPIELLADGCERIAAGEREVVLIGGVECFDVLLRAMKEGRETGFASQPEGTVPDRIVGVSSEPSHPVETAAGLIAPVAYYPLIESAVRAASSHAPGAHLEHLGELWARFAAVAADNPYAWTREAPDAARITTPAADNRQVTIPYTKLMNSNIQTNQAAALVICSQAAADGAGIARAQQVRVRATATASDHQFVASRPDLARSPAIAAGARAALGHCGFGIEQIRHLDLYSCFPSAVAVAARELGVDPLDPERPPSVTGGLAFAGGPGSNYVTHSLAALCERVTCDGGVALATAVGWYLSKHGIAVLAPVGEVGEEPYAHFSPQAEVDISAKLEIEPPPDSGTANVEAYTAICDRSGAPELGIASFRLSDGARTVAKADDHQTLAALAERDCLGAAAAFVGGGRFRLG